MKMTMKKHWYLLSGIIFSALIVLIILVEHKGNYYKVTPEQVQKKVLNDRIVMNSETISNLKESVLLICLSGNVEDSINSLNYVKTLKIKPEDLLKTENRKLYEDHSGIIILHSDDLTLEANAYVLLSRMGYKNVKIWTDKDDDKLNYSFQPDSLAGLK